MGLPFRRGLSRFLALTRPVFRSEARWAVRGLLALLLLLIGGLGALNVLSSYANRDFMTAVAGRDASGAARFALLWSGVFAGLTVVSVLKSFTEERLRLRWRAWLTTHLIDRYLSARNYYRLRNRGEVDNPDQRMSEDVRTFTDHTLALLLIFVNSAIQLATFSGILWSISPWLFLAAILYTVFGTVMTVLVGARLVRLDVLQFRREADLRYELIQVRTQAESIALLAGEPGEKVRLAQRLEAVVQNMKAVIGLSRNISFFTVGYDYLTQLIPLLIVVPLYIRGDVEFGMVTQSVMAFAFVVNAFSVIVKEFQRLSTFRAVVERLGGFHESLEATPHPGAPPVPAASGIQTVVDEGRIAFERLTLTVPDSGRVLVEDLSVQVPSGKRLLVTGPSGSGRTSLLRAAAGLWTSGRGRVVRPPLEQIYFLPQRPYLPAGTLRGLLLGAARDPGLPDELLLEALEGVRFGASLVRLGGLGRDADWGQTLSAGEQRQVALAALLLAQPRFAFLDEPTSSLDAGAAEHVFDRLARTAEGWVTISSDPALRKYHHSTLELLGGGAWREAARRSAASA